MPILTDHYLPVFTPISARSRTDRARNPTLIWMVLPRSSQPAEVERLAKMVQ
jgi:hypothetical protein